jgi:mannose-1-phosphate guanylyltransferase
MRCEAAEEAGMFAVIMAGGSGTRFWPSSRENLPKQFLRITSDRTMFEETLARVRLFAQEDQIFAVVGANHAGLVSDTSGCRILAEPVGRNTAACIALAAVHINAIDADEPIAVLPADHFVSNVELFAKTIEAAGEIARNGSIVTIGIEPTRPETGYGYLEIGERVNEIRELPRFRMVRFVEKPDTETARKYLESGRYLWNSGIFVFTARTILREIRTCLPEMAAEFDEIAKAIGLDNYDAAVKTAYERVESVSIDYGIMERTSAPVYALKAGFGWSDVGSWQALYELRSDEYDENRNLLLGDVKAIQAKSNFVFADAGRLVALLDVEGLVIVDTKDALLIARLESSQDVKKVAEVIRKEEGM